MTDHAPRVPSDLPPAALEALRKGKRIEAIKILRRERGLDLLDAKQAVDQSVRANPALERSMRAAQAEANRRCVLWVLVILGLAVAGYFVLAGR
ncbi:MAG: hypothetical protein ACREIS_07405 [Nitrospiraceae bacterium]